MIDTWLGIFGIVLGILFGVPSLWFAFQQRNDFKNYSQMVQSDNWLELNMLSQAHAHIQLARQRLTLASGSALDAEVIGWLAMADTFGQDTTKQVIKRILLSQPKVRYSDIERWHREGKLNESHRELAIRLAVAPELPDGISVGFSAGPPASSSLR